MLKRQPNSYEQNIKAGLTGDTRGYEQNKLNAPVMESEKEMGYTEKDG